MASQPVVVIVVLHHDLVDEVDDGPRRLLGVVLGKDVALVVTPRLGLPRHEAEHLKGGTP